MYIYIYIHIVYKLRQLDDAPLELLEVDPAVPVPVEAPIII